MTVNDIKDMVPEELWEQTREEYKEYSDRTIAEIIINELVENYYQRKMYNIVNKLSYEFCLEFYTRLKETFGDKPIYVLPNTIGWDNCFSSTCVHFKMYDLRDFYQSLDWEDSDIFDYYLEQHMYYMLAFYKDMENNE